MSRRMTKSDLSRDEISLLINSEEAKNTQLYGNLYDILLQIKELKAISLEELERRNLNYYGISALSYNKRTLIDNATKEWQATTDIIDNPERNASCQLCNAPRLRYECHIRNLHNNVNLLVGSECVNKFKINGYIDQNKQLLQIQKGHKIVQRKNEFYKRFPDCEQFIVDADKYFSTLPILLPYDIYTKLQDAVNRLRLIYSKYVNENKKPFYSIMDSFELFQLAINQYSKFKLLADNYVSENMSNPLICKRREINWLISNNKQELLKQISENNGIYTLDTLKNICLFNFVKEYSNLFLLRNQSSLFKLEKFSNNSIIFSFNKLGYHPSLVFIVPLDKFMLNIGANCIINNSYTYSGKDILNISRIADSIENLYSILNYIDNIMNRFSCVFLVDDSTNSLYLYRKGDKAIRQFAYNNFMKAYSKYILSSDEKIKKYLFSVIKDANSKKWITQEVQEKQGIYDKIGKLYKEYRHVHEYATYHINENKFEVIIYATNNNSYIDFNRPEYVSLQRNRLKVKDSQLEIIDYGIFVSDDSLEPIYHKGDILFIQIVQKVKNASTIFFVTEDGFNVKQCYTESEESESIFKFMDISKSKLQAYGRIVYYLRNELNREDYPKANEKIVIDERNTKIRKDKSEILKICVVDKPKHCLKCQSSCMYKLVEYIKNNQSTHKINVAVCPKCNKLYIGKKFYNQFKNGNEKTNIVFKV